MSVSVISSENSARPLMEKFECIFESSRISVAVAVVDFVFLSLFSE